MRAIEKGATYLDKLCHKFYDEPKGCGNKTDYVCRLCGGPLETYYCEERLYLVQCADCGTLSLVKTANPEDAARVTLARSTLTPPNEPLPLEQLREMDGEPVWVQTPGIPKYGRWVIVAGVDTEDGQRTLYCQGDYTCRNYGRDWLAYRRPPEGEADETE